MSASYNSNKIIKKYFNKEGDLLQWHWEPKSETVHKLRCEIAQLVYDGGMGNRTHPVNEIFSEYNGMNKGLVKTLKELADWENTLLYKQKINRGVWR